MIENDSEERYQELHKGHELAEIYSKLSKDGEVLPPCIKDGLKICIKLPANDELLPTLLYLGQ